MEYIKSCLVLFVLMTLLLYLVPGERLKRYIRFFTEIIVTVGILSPVLSFVFDSDEFLAKIEYETFKENLSEIARDMERMEYIQNDFYIEEYENAIEEDVKLIVSPVAESYGYCINAADVHLTEEYTLERITLTVAKPKTEEIMVDDVLVRENTAADYAINGKNGMVAQMKQQLAEYYKMQEEQIEVKCKEAG